MRFGCIIALAAIVLFTNILCDVEEVRHPISDKIIESYIDLSMNLTFIFKNTSISEASLHELSKKIVSRKGFEDEIQGVLDKYMDSLNETQKKEFGELYFDKVKLDYITKKVHRVLGFYLTKNQIQRIRDILQTKFDAGATRAQYVEAMVEELTKDIGREKAVKAIESTMKDLKIFAKKNPGYVEQAEKLFHHVTTIHDEM